MHVGMVCPYSMREPGGVQEHVRGLSKGLVDLGCDVSLFAPELSSSVEGLEGVQGFSLGRTVNVRANGSVAPLGLDPRMLVQLDVGFDPVDVVHLQEPFLPAGLASLLRVPKGVPVVGTFHAAADRFWPYALAKPLIRRAAKGLRSSVAVSPEARRLVRRYVPIDPEIVPNGVDVSAFAEATPDPWAEGLGTVVLFVGRPEARKGFDLCVRAFCGAAARRPEAHLVCVPARPEDVSLVSDAVEGRVHCLGRVPRERLLALYRAADVVCAPARGGESFGLVVVEGLAAGAAVLASDIPGYRYAGGDAARYLPPGDLPSWRRALEELLVDDRARTELAEAGPARARTFDWPRVSERILGVYGE